VFNRLDFFPAKRAGAFPLGLPRALEMRADPTIFV